MAENALQRYRREQAEAAAQKTAAPAEDLNAQSSFGAAGGAISPDVRTAQSPTQQQEADRLGLSATESRGQKLAAAAGQDTPYTTGGVLEGAKSAERVGIPTYSPPSGEFVTTEDRLRYEASYAQQAAADSQRQTDEIRTGVGGEQEEQLGRDVERSAAERGRVVKTSVNPEYAKLTESQKKLNLQNKEAGRSYVKEIIDTSSGRQAITGGVDKQAVANFNQAVNMLESGDESLVQKGSAMFATLPQDMQDNYNKHKAKDLGPVGKTAEGAAKEEKAIRDSLGMSDTDELTMTSDGEYLINGKTESEDAMARATERSDRERKDDLEDMAETQESNEASIRSAYTVDGKMSKQGARVLADSKREYKEILDETNQAYDDNLDDYLRAEKKRDGAVRLNNTKSESASEKMNRAINQERLNGAAALQKEYLAKGIDKSFEAALNEYKARQAYDTSEPTYADKAKEIDTEMSGAQFDVNSTFALATSKFGGNTSEAQKYMASRGFLGSDIDTQLEEYQKNTLGYSDEEINGFARPMSKARKLQESLVTQEDPLSAAIMLGSYKNTLDELDETPDKQIVRAGLQGVIAGTQNEVLKSMAQDMLDDMASDIDMFGKDEFLAGMGTPEQRQNFISGTSQLAAAGRAPKAAKVARAAGGGGTGGGDSTLDSLADSFVTSFNVGQFTQKEILSTIGSTAINAPLRNLVAQKIAAQGGKRIFGQDSATILDIRTQINALQQLKNNDLFEVISGPIQLGALGSGQKGDALTLIDSVLSSQTLNSLAEAKSRGITFGALSEGELGLVAAAAGRLAARAKKGDDGQISGFRGSESAFKKDLDLLIEKLGRSIERKTEGRTTTPQPTLQEGEIQVIEKSSGQRGTIPANEFDPELFTKTQ